jgi:hypothetical protein
MVVQAERYRIFSRFELDIAILDTSDGSNCGGSYDIVYRGSEECMLVSYGVIRKEDDK